jgi:hypothetical protein
VSTFRGIVWGMQKFILGLLLFCVGGVAPLTYFTPLSPHYLPVYYISILEPSVHVPDASILPAEIRELLHPRSSPQFLASYADSISSPNLARGVSFSFQLNLSFGYLLPAMQKLLPLLFLAQLVLATLLVRCSAWLPLPDQPPRLWLIRV